MQLANSTQYLISPFIAGILLSVFNIKLIFAIDIFTFIVALLSILWVRKSFGKVKTIKGTNRFVREFKEGFLELSRNKGVLSLVITTTVVLFFVGILQSLFPPMILSLSTKRELGIIQSLIATGMIVGSMFIGVFGSTKKYVKLLVISLFFTGLSFSFIGVYANLVLITIFGFLFFSFLPFVNTSIEVLIRNNIPNEKQGRLWSIISTITYSGSVLAFMIAGILADKTFIPLLMDNGLLASSVGKIIGTGATRGIGLMFVVSGVFISLTSLVIIFNKNVSRLEK